MANREGDRQPWEYASGPKVGTPEVPITGEPRDEEAPGVPAPPEQASEPDRETEGKATEVREVRSADPELSERTNARLTDELREVVGSDELEVPTDRPHTTRGEEPSGERAESLASMHGFQLVRSAAIILTFGAIVALITNDWWVLALAAGVHALGTMTVYLTSLRMTTIIEHPSPQVAAAMSEEGVSSPDERFSRMVEEFRPAQERGAGEVLSPGFNERSAEAGSAEGQAEQTSALTPTAQPSRPAGQGGAPDLLIWATIVSLLVLSIVLPAVTGGGWMWLLTAVMLPLLGGWIGLQWLMRARSERLHLQGARPLVLIVLCTAAAVAGFCAVVAFAFHH